MTANTNPQAHDIEALFDVVYCEENNDDADSTRRLSAHQSPSNTANDSPSQRRSSWTLFLQEEYERSLHEDGGLDKKLRDMKSSQSDLPSDNVFATPVLALLRSWGVTIAVSGFSVAAIGHLLSNWLPSLQIHNDYSIFRFTASGSFAIANTTTFAILTKCGKLFPSNQTISGSSVTLAFPEPVPMTGWGYTLPGSDGAHPEAWAGEGMAPSDADFSRIKRHGIACEKWKVADASKPSAEFFFRSDTGQMIALVSSIITILGPALTLYYASRRRVMLAKHVLAAACFLVCVMSLAAGVVLSVRAEGGNGVRWFKLVPVLAIVFPPLAFTPLEQYFVPCCIASGLVGVSAELLSLVWDPGDCATLRFILLQPVIYAALVFLGTGIWITWKRRQIWADIHQGMELYRTQFNAAWTEIQSRDPDAAETLYEIKQECARIRSHAPPLQAYRIVRPPPTLARSPSASIVSSPSPFGPFGRRRSSNEAFPSAMPQPPPRHGWRAWVPGSLSHGLSVRSSLGQSFNTVLGQTFHSVEEGREEGVVRSMEQLYAQAAGCQRLLRKTVKAVAEANQGMLPVRVKRHSVGGGSDSWVRRGDGSSGLGARGISSPVGSRSGSRAAVWGEVEFVPWSEAVRDTGVQREIRWTPLKPHRRALVKVLYRYRGQCARLVDVCRETIVVPSLASLLSCLRQLMADPDIHILRIKNSLDPDVDPPSGFRAVSINLRFVGPDAQALGVQSHASELLLILHSFAVWLSEEQHRVYQRSRMVGGAVAEEVNFQRSHSSLQWLRAPSLSPNTRPISWLRHGSTSRESSLDFERPDGAAVQVTASIMRLGASDEQPAQRLPSQAFRHRPGHSVSEHGYTQRAMVGGEEWPCALGAEDPVAGGPEACHKGALKGRVLLEQYRSRSMRLGDWRLFRWRPTLAESVEACSAVSVFSTSFPIAAAVRKRIFTGFMLILSAAAAFLLSSWPRRLQLTDEGKWLRFSALQLRDPSIAPTHPVVESLHLRHNGCKLPAVNTTISPDLRTYTLRLADTAVQFDEIAFETPRRGDPASDPVVFAMHVSDDNHTWRFVAASRKAPERDGDVRFENETRSVPKKRGHTVSVSIRSLWYIGTTAQNIAGIFGGVGIMAAYVLRKYEWGFYVVFSCICWVFLCRIVEVVGRFVNEYYIGFPQFSFSMLFVDVGLASWFWHRERDVMEIMWVMGATNIVFKLITDLFVDPEPSRTWTNPATVSWVMVLGSPVILVLKYRTARTALASIAEDMGKYDAVWQRVLSDEREVAGTARITALLSSVPRGARLHQQYPLPVEAAPIKASKGLFSVLARRRAGGAVKTARVETLGLLYRQAAGVYWLARAKIKEWCNASPSGGMLVGKTTNGLQVFQLKSSLQPSEGERERAREREGGSEQASEGRSEQRKRPGEEERERERESEGFGDGREGRHSLTMESVGEREGGPDELWPPLKTVQRSSEKLMRSYAADVSRLLDVCRFSVVLDHTWEIAELLEIIVNDPDVKVASAKNRLNPQHDATQTGGFRDVHLNLVMTSDEAKRMNLQFHVWELQLLLAPLAALRSDGGHRRYVEYRNARAQ